MTDDTTGWDTPAGAVPPPEAFHVERVIDPFTRRAAVGQVRHAGHAFIAPAPVQDDPVGDAAPWHRIARRYLLALNGAVRGLPAAAHGLVHADVWSALTAEPAPVPSPASRPALRWLDIGWDGPQVEARLKAVEGIGGVAAWTPRTLASFWVRRSGSAAAGGDDTLVVVAGCVEGGLQLGMDLGARVVMQVREGRVRIHGVTFSGLDGPRALQARPPAAPKDSADPFAWVSRLRPAIGQALGHGQHVWISNIETTPEPGDPPTRLRANGFALRAPDIVNDRAFRSGDRDRRARKRWLVYDFSVDLDAAPGQRPRVVRVNRNEYASAAAAPPGVFRADGASQHPPAGMRQGLVARRPTRDEAALDALGLRRPWTGAPAAGQVLQGFAVSGGPVLHETRATAADPVDAPTQALAARGVSGGRADLACRTPAAGDDPFWTDRHAQLEAFVRSAELFERFSAYGIDPFRYFRFASLPLVSRARAALRWAPEGDVPNAEVRPFIDDPEQHPAPRRVPDTAARPQLLVKYGSADPMHRRRVPLDPGADPAAASAARERAEYLGVAADRRWAWHEFGHVLAYASTGELEFAFAHSAGDALAAIVADPDSALAGEPESDERFASYPWIEVPGRSHGRDAWQGYCWCGRRNLLRLAVPTVRDRYHHDYFEEQLLSSSLFRLYRALGGDTRPPAGGPDAAADRAVRLSASDYCVYLVMRAISLLGPDTVAPARTPDQFVSALIDADLGTGDWTIDAPWPHETAAGRSGHAALRRVRRHGGQVHKVIRWAFERQGLYATDAPDATAEGPGLPPPVDVFVADRRPPDAPGGPRGGYAPVPLRPPGADRAADADAAWLADPAWLRREGRDVALRIGNRGSHASGPLALRLWWGEWRSGAIAWCAAPRAQAHDAGVPPGGDVTVALRLPDEAPGDRPLWLLAAVDAAADPSNLRADGGARPPGAPQALLQLVASDNNLALAPPP